MRMRGENMNKEHENLLPTFLPISIIGRPFSLAHSLQQRDPDVCASINFYGVVSKALAYRVHHSQILVE